MVILCLALALLCAGLAFWVWAQRRSLRGAARQLRELEEQGSAARIRLAAPNGTAEDLLEAVNRLLELRRADRAESRAREQELRRQISNISHDLRTPLTSILGYLQLLEGEDLTAAQRAEYLAVVKSRAQALQSLITSFYDLSRLEGGEFPLEVRPVDLRGAIAQLLAAFYNDFTDAGFDVEVDLPEGLPSVQVDPGGVLRVFTNLLRNALDHGAGPMEIRAWPEGERVVTTFSNAAPGLSEEDAGHVFDRFFTADKMRTGRNTGLGLAIVKSLGEQMGAGVRSELSGGRFTVRLDWKLWGKKSGNAAAGAC